MKFILLLGLLAAFVAAEPQTQKVQVFTYDIEDAKATNRNLLITLFINQMIVFIRNVILHGSEALNLPPLDPLILDEYHLSLNNGIFNAEIDVTNGRVDGIGGFVVHKSVLSIPELSFDLDISVPSVKIFAEKYDFLGDLFTAIPLYGNGGTEFLVEDLKIAMKLYLKQSDDGESVLIDRIENTQFSLGNFKSNLSGVIGGGDIDAIINAFVEEVLFGYIQRFSGAIAKFLSHAIVEVGNPILDQLDTWRFIEVFL